MAGAHWFVPAQPVCTTPRHGSGKHPVPLFQRSDFSYEARIAKTPIVPDGQVCRRRHKKLEGTSCRIGPNRTCYSTTCLTRLFTMVIEVCSCQFIPSKSSSLQGHSHDFSGTSFAQRRPATIFGVSPRSHYGCTTSRVRRISHLDMAFRFHCRELLLKDL